MKRREPKPFLTKLVITGAGAILGLLASASALADGGILPIHFCTKCTTYSGTEICDTILCFGNSGCFGQVCPDEMSVRACCGSSCPDDDWLTTCQVH